jgi:hypothetical protein
MNDSKYEQLCCIIKAPRDMQIKQVLILCNGLTTFKVRIREQLTISGLM